MTYYDGIIFDLDGTLWQTQDSYIYAYHRILENHPEIKKHYTNQDIIATMGLTLIDVGNVVFSTFDTAKRVELMIEGLTYSCEYLLKNESTIYPNVIETIKELSKTTKLFIVSNCPKEYLDTFFVKSDLRNYFIDYKYLTLDTNKKNNFKSLVKENNLHKVLMVGDSIDDYEACEANVDFVYASYGYRKCENYQYIIKDFKELLGIISYVNYRSEVIKDAKYKEIINVNDAEVVLMKNEFQKDSDYLFGFWRYSKNEQSNELLFDKLEKRAKELGVNEIIGPLDYATWFKYRLAIDNFDWVLYPDINNSKEQVEFLEKRGYIIKCKYSSTLSTLDRKFWNTCQKVKLSSDYDIKVFKGQDAYQSIKDIYDISIDCFKDAYLYSPIDFDTFKKLYLQNISKVHPVVVLIYYKELPIAFSFCYPNLEHNFYVSKTTGIKKKFQNSKVILKLIDIAFKNMTDLGYNEVLFHYQNEEKNVNRIWRYYIIKQKHYALFSKEL